MLFYDVCTIIQIFNIIVANFIGEDKMDWEVIDMSHTIAQVTHKQYDCCICSQTTPSTEENPIGLVVLIQVGVPAFVKKPFIPSEFKIQVERT